MTHLSTVSSHQTVFFRGPFDFELSSIAFHEMVVPFRLDARCTPTELNVFAEQATKRPLHTPHTPPDTVACARVNRVKDKLGWFQARPDDAVRGRIGADSVWV